MLTYLPWVIVVLLAITSFVIALLWIRAGRRHARATAAHDAAKAALAVRCEELARSLTAEQQENGEHRRLLALLERTRFSQPDRSVVAVYDSGSEQLAAGQDEVPPLLLSMLGESEEPLPTRLRTAAAQEDPAARVITTAAGRVISVSCARDEQQEAYLLTDVTDSCRLPGVLEQNAALLAQWQTGDILTPATGYEAWLAAAEERMTERSAEQRFLLRLTTASGLAAQRRGVEAARQVLGEDGSRGQASVARHGADGVCALLTGRDPAAATVVAQRILDALAGVEGRDFCATASLMAAAPGSIKEMLLCLTATERQRRMAGERGPRIVEACEVPTMLNRKRELDTLLDGSFRFLYRPIATAADARVYGYVMEPDVEGSAFETAEEAARQAALFERAENWEHRLLDEGLKAYHGEVKAGKLLYNTYIVASSFAWSQLSATNERALIEEHFDDLHRLSVRVEGATVDSLRSLMEKEKQIRRLGAACAMRYDGSEFAALAIYCLGPAFVYVDVTLAGDTKGKAQIKAVAAQLHAIGARLVVDGITTEAELETAIGLGADLLLGDYIGRGESDPGEISEKSMKVIGKAKFGKRGARK